MRKTIYMLIISFIFLSSCTINGGSKVTNSSTAGSATPLISSTSPTNSPDENDSKPYAQAYYNVIANLISQYGFYSDDSIYNTMGFIRGELIDFDGDEIPEFVCIYRKEFFNNVSIYRYSDSRAELLVDELVGDSVFGDNLSYINFNNTDGKSNIVTEKCVWGEVERIRIFSVDKGVLRTKKFRADVQGDHEIGDVHFMNCQIDGKNVSEEEYNAKKENYIRDGIFWNEVKENGEYRDYTKDDAVQFIKTLLFFIYNFSGGNILKAYTPLEQLIVESIKIQYRGGDTKELERIYTSDFIKQINNDPEYFYQKWILFRIDDDFMNSFSELNNNQATVEVRVIDLRSTYFQEITLTKDYEGNYKISNILYDI